MENERYNKLAKWIIAATGILYFLPWLLLGHNNYFRLHDNLEGEWIWLKILVDGHTAYTFHPYLNVPELMNGLPRSVFPTAMSVNMLLVQLFGAFYGYLISNVLIRVIGFAGMVLLLRTYFIKERENQFIVWLCALIFAVLPVFIPFGITVLGQPLLLWAFLNLHNRQRKRVSLAIIGLFPFYSSVVWLLIPFATLLGIAGLHFLRKGTLNKHYVAGFFLLTGMFLLVNAPIISTAFIQGNFLPHRQAYNLYMFETPKLVDAIGETFHVLFISHYHVATLLANICFIAMLLMARKRYPLISELAWGIVAVAVFQGFYSYAEYAIAGKSDLVKSFRFNRFSMLLPFMWLFAFALCLYRMRESVNLKPLIMPFIVLQLLVALCGNDEIVHNYRYLTGHQKFPGYNNYFAPRQFEEIKKYIGQPVDSYRVASLGMSPSVAQYNGMYTLDGLMSVYDLRYKEKFRKVFAEEIAESRDIQQYFDGWGNRCYIFSSELGIKHEAYNCFKHTGCAVEDFDFDARAFSEIGGKYLLSAVEIKNHSEQGLQFEKVFTDEQSWWKVYLYSVKI